MELVGKLHEIFETKTIKDTFTKREFILEYAEDPNFPQYIKFEVILDKCEELNDFKKGDIVRVLFNIKGRPWTNPKGETIYFTTLQAWKITSEKNGEKAAKGSEIDEFLADGDDMPF